MTEFNNNETVTISLERYEILRNMAQEDGKKIELLETELLQYGKVLHNDFIKGWIIITEAENAEITKNSFRDMVENKPKGHYQNESNKYKNM